MTEIKKYSVLNDLAEKGGTVIFGGKEDKDIPLCELRQAFELGSNYYNRSFENLSIANAAELYLSSVAPLAPETVLLHIGENDLDLFENNPDKFLELYRELVCKIKSESRDCYIAIVSLKNYDNDSLIAKLNERLKYLADSERCEFVDVSQKKVWNPRSTKDAISFICSLGFVRNLKSHEPVYDLARTLFCYA